MTPGLDKSLWKAGSLLGICNPLQVSLILKVDMPQRLSRVIIVSH